MKMIANVFGVLATLGGMVCAGYAFYVPYTYNLSVDRINVADGAVYQKATYYAVMAIALFAFSILSVISGPRMENGKVQQNTNAPQPADIDPRDQVLYQGPNESDAEFNKRIAEAKKLGK